MKTDQRTLFQYASYTALAAAVSMSVMLVIMSIHPFSSPLHFEQVKPAREFAFNLLQGGIPLRFVLTIDHMFLVFVAATFLLAAQAIRGEGNKLITTVIAVPVLVTAFLDIYENHHIAVMLMAAVQNLPITQAEINQQALFSLMKFHTGNLSYFMLAFFLPSDSVFEKIFRYSLLFVLLPVSVMRYSFADLMEVRIFTYVPIAIGLFAASYVFYRRSHASSNR